MPLLETNPALINSLTPEMVSRKWNFQREIELMTQIWKPITECLQCCNLKGLELGYTGWVGGVWLLQQNLELKIKLVAMYQLNTDKVRLFLGTEQHLIVITRLWVSHLQLMIIGLYSLCMGLDYLSTDITAILTSFALGFIRIL